MNRFVYYNFYNHLWIIMVTPVIINTSNCINGSLTLCAKFTSRKVHVSCGIGEVARGASLRNARPLRAVVTGGTGASSGIILWV